MLLVAFGWLAEVLDATDCQLSVWHMQSVTLYTLPHRAVAMCIHGFPHPTIDQPRGDLYGTRHGESIRSLYTDKSKQ